MTETVYISLADLATAVGVLSRARANYELPEPSRWQGHPWSVLLEAERLLMVEASEQHGSVAASGLGDEVFHPPSEMRQ